MLAGRLGSRLLIGYQLPERLDLLKVRLTTWAAGRLPADPATDRMMRSSPGEFRPRSRRDRDCDAALRWRRVQLCGGRIEPETLEKTRDQLAVHAADEVRCHVGG